MPPTTRFLILVLLLGASTPGQDGRELFFAHCATCHGPTGRGDGPTAAEPRPRDLTSGRFSFGTTAEALARTVRDGVAPGMPPFEGKLDSAEFEAVITYARSLIPETIEAAAEASRVAIGADARVVRGYLPAVGMGGPTPRGMVIGLTNGWGLEYRTDDLRLLRLRTPDPDGAFVDRTDWRGRGGSPLELLGALVPSEDPNPGPTVSTAQGKTALRLDFDGHRVIGPRVRLEGRVIDSGAAIAQWRETVRGVETDIGSGIHRRIEIRAEGPPFELRLRVGAVLGSAAVNHGERNTIRGKETSYWAAMPRDGTFAVLIVRAPRSSYLTIPGGRLEVVVPLGDRPLTRVDVLRMELPRMQQLMTHTLAEEFDR